MSDLADACLSLVLQPIKIAWHEARGGRSLSRAACLDAWSILCMSAWSQQAKHAAMQPYLPVAAPGCQAVHTDVDWSTVGSEEA